MRKKKADVLVVTPHPDDAEFGVAGTVVKWIREGKSVAYVVCTNGDKGTEDFSIKPEQLAKIQGKGTVGSNQASGCERGCVPQTSRPNA